jgi:hypothetical protein
MDIKVSSNNITINGNIKSVGNFQTIKQELDAIIGHHKSLTINVVDSLSITSSVIGYLNKLVLKDNINIKMNIGNAQLIELLDDLSLTSTFNAKKA